MDKNISTGLNRTGMKASPIDAKRLLEVQELQTSMPRPPISADAMRAVYRREAEPMGSVPPPTNIRGVVGTATQALAGHKMHVLLDKLAERLAYERTGVRIYDAMLRKLVDVDPLPEGLSVAGLEEIRAEELAHFHMLAECIEKLGGDSTAMTPCANLVGVKGLGMVQAMNDPRLTIAQALDTLLGVEVMDVASWELLIELVDGFGLDEMASQFAAALAAENRHEATVRSWLTAAMSDAAFV